MKTPDLDPNDGLQAARNLVKNFHKIDLFFRPSNAFNGKSIKILVNRHDR